MIDMRICHGYAQGYIKIWINGKYLPFVITVNRYGYVDCGFPTNESLRLGL